MYPNRLKNNRVERRRLLVTPRFARITEPLSLVRAVLRRAGRDALAPRAVRKTRGIARALVRTSKRLPLIYRDSCQSCEKKQALSESCFLLLITLK